jgi:hypothetical protein
MKEVIFDYEEFKGKVDTTKPIHHCAWRKGIDKHGVFYRIEFRILGISKNGNHIVVWHAERRTTISDSDRKADKEWYNQVVETYAKPLGSTEGEWIP